MYDRKISSSGLFSILTSCLQVAAKYVFVRILRNSRHLQADTFIHWTTWLSCTIFLGAVSFILAEAIPVFTYIISLSGSICFAPLAIILPGWLWLYDHSRHWKGNVYQVAAYLFHVGIVLLGVLFLVGGTYGVVEQIIDAYKSGSIGEYIIFLLSYIVHGLVLKLTDFKQGLPFRVLIIRIRPEWVWVGAVFGYNIGIVSSTSLDNNVKTVSSFQEEHKDRIDDDVVLVK